MTPRSLTPRALAFAGAIAVLPSAGAAQDNTVAEALEFYQTNYDRAKAAYDSAYAATGLEGLEAQWAEVLTQLDSLREDDSRRRGNLEARGRELSDQIARGENEVVAFRDQWCQTGEELIGAIDALLQVLEGQTEPERTTDGDPVWDRASNLFQRTEDIETEMQQTAQCGSQTLQPFPQIQPGDGPTENRLYAEFFENQVSQHRDWLVDIEERIEFLVRQQRRERSLADYLDGRRGPVLIEDRVGGEQVRMEGDALDAAEADLPRVPIEQRIENLELLRDQVARRISELEERAKEFRARAGVGSGVGR